MPTSLRVQATSTPSFRVELIECVDHMRARIVSYPARRVSKWQAKFAFDCTKLQEGGLVMYARFPLTSLCFQITKSKKKYTGSASEVYLQHKHQP